MALDTALHLGDALYGNIGAGDWLDFTAIGQAVNEASRIEALADQLDTNFLVSEAFAHAASLCRPHLRSQERHALRGLDREQELFTLLKPNGWLMRRTYALWSEDVSILE